jgi:hypothetical protein
MALAVPCFFQMETFALSQLLDALLIRIAQSSAPVAFPRLPDLTAAMGKLTGGSSLKGATLSSVMYRHRRTRASRHAQHKAGHDGVR